jgi:hypothetical protein
MSLLYANSDFFRNSFSILVFASAKFMQSFQICHGEHAGGGLYSLLESNVIQFMTM